MFAGTYAPEDWAFCDGSLLSINEFELLFQLIGTTYGGDGLSTFAVPDLRGRIPVSQGQGARLSSYALGETGGAEEVMLTVSTLPAHDHAPGLGAFSGDATTPNPAANVLAQAASGDLFVDDTPGTPMSPAALGTAGGTTPHANVMPYMAVNFIIALVGTFPAQG